MHFYNNIKFKKIFNFIHIIILNKVLKEKEKYNESRLNINYIDKIDKSALIIFKMTCIIDQAFILEATYILE